MDLIFIILIVFFVSFFWANCFFGGIVERLKEVYPNEFKKYLHIFGLRLKFWYFVQNVRNGVITDHDLLRYYSKIRIPLMVAGITWIVGLCLMTFDYLFHIHW